MLFSLNPAAMPEGYGEALVPLAMAKAWLNVAADEDEFDQLVVFLRDAAVDMVEQVAAEYLGPRTGAVITFPGFGSDMRLHRGPNSALSVTAIGYVDQDGNPASIADGAWRVRHGKLMPALNACWPVSYGDVTVTFNGGYPAGTCPPRRKMAVQFALGFLFLHRDAIVSEGMEAGVPPGVLAYCDAPVLI